MPKELPTVNGVSMTEWDCPECSECNREEGDISGEETTCMHCGCEVLIDRVM